MSKKLFFSLVACLTIVLVAWAANSSFNSEKSSVKVVGGDQYEREYSVSIGPDDAKVTLVEFFDPACEACRAFYPHVKEILARHPEDVRLVLRYAAFHEGSDTVIKMLEAARLQNMFVPVLEALLKDQNQWASHHKPNLERAWELAETAGLDIQQAKKIISTGKFDALLEQEKADIRALKVGKTPTFFVNNKPLGLFGLEQLYKLIVDEINNTN